MPIFEGIVAPDGTIVRSRGTFTVVSKQTDLLELDFNTDVSEALVLATAWRDDGDFGPQPVAAGPNPGAAERYLFAVEDYMGVSFRLDTEPVDETDGGVAEIDAATTRAWYAWNNRMPPAPPTFHITGEVLVANPGVEPTLTLRENPSGDPSHILLDLYLRHRSGLWPQVLVWKQVRYERRIDGDFYTTADVFFGGQRVARVSVENVS